MSKVVSGVGRAIGKVVSGVVKAVKKVAKSKIGKMILIGAAMYFGIPAAMGAMGAGGAAAAGGLSGMAGATANLGAAWSGLASAGSSVMAGEFGTAASSLGEGFAGGASSVAEAGATTAADTGLAGLGTTAPANPGVMGVTAPATQTAAAAPGKFSLMNFMNTKGGAAAVQVGGGLIGGLGQGVAAQSQQNHAEQMSADERARRNTNIGARVFARPA